MDPRLFATDLASKPEHLGVLADHLRSVDPWQDIAAAVGRVIFLGMGSSAFAASVVAARLQAKGVDAVSVLASSDLLPLPRSGDLVVAISAGGESRETAVAVEQYLGKADVVLLTNVVESPLARLVGRIVEMKAGVEAGGVACRSFQHSLFLLMALEQRLTERGRDLPLLIDEVSAAGQDLADRSDDWLPSVRELIDGPQGVHIVGPMRRLSSAQQSALMLREGPRRQAYACETGDWSHIDVYLTKTTDYRMLLLAGSRWEDDVMKWVRERGSTVVAIGGDVAGTAMNLRYRGDSDDDIRLLTEVMVAELLAADLWTAQTS